MKNVFSAEEKTPEVDPAFYDQPQAGTQPTAPSCNPKVPAPAPVPLRIGEAAAEHASDRLDWKNTQIGR